MNKFATITMAAVLFGSAALAQAGIFEFQQGSNLDLTLGGGVYAGAQDSVVNSGQPTTNFGSNDLLTTGDNDFFQRAALLSFDISPLSDLTGNIAGIELELTVSSASIPVSGADLILAPLETGNFGWTEAGVTWNTQDGATPWLGGASGARGAADFDSTNQVEINIVIGDLPGLNDVITFVFSGDSTVLSALFDTWATNGGEAHFVLYSAETNTDLSFFSKESSVGDAPLLRFNAPDLDNGVIPEPASAALLGLAGLALLRRRRQA